MTKRHKREISGSLEVAGFPMRWSLRSEQVWSPDGNHVGLCLSVERSDETRRELVLEYPYQELGKTGRPDVNPDRIADDVRQAMEAGWKPKSRGRPFIFVLD